MPLTRMKVSVFVGGAIIASALAQQAPSPAEREAHWLQDLQALSSGLKAPGVRIAAGIGDSGFAGAMEAWRFYRGSRPGAGCCGPRELDLLAADRLVFSL
jgi:hypothetical protein